MAQTVKIPDSSNPFVVKINNYEYSYKAGTTQSVPDEVAAVIAAHNSARPVPDESAGLISWNDLKDRPFYSTEVESEIVSGTFGFSYSSGYGQYTNELEINVDLVEGKKYKVVFDGVEYETVCQLFMGQYKYIGDPGLLNIDLGHSSFPFLYVRIMGNSIFGTLLTDETHDIVIKGVERDYVKLPEYYLPDEKIILKSSTSGSAKKFKITVDDGGTISATEV